jgi:hypothetical protein
MNSAGASVIVLCRVRPLTGNPSSGHAHFVHGHQSSIRDRHAVRIARQVGQHGPGPANGRLAYTTHSHFRCSASHG